MRRIIQFSIRRGERQYVAECMDLGIVTQARTLDELAANIEEAVGLFFEGEDPAEHGIAKDAVVLATLELNAAA
jgi:predicted RNase H-like HicB family nuclease